MKTKTYTLPHRGESKSYTPFAPTTPQLHLFFIIPYIIYYDI